VNDINANGAPLILQPVPAGAAVAVQVWCFIPVADMFVPILPPRIYTVRNTVTGTVLDLAADQPGGGLGMPTSSLFACGIMLTFFSLLFSYGLGIAWSKSPEGKRGNIFHWHTALILSTQWILAHNPATNLYRFQSVARANAFLAPGAQGRLVGQVAAPQGNFTFDILRVPGTNNHKCEVC
jgi:hypothetical protein